MKIVGLCVVSSILYGILHDLVTANVCVEYFSVFHPDIFHTDSPWLLALGWGVIATWWMGLFIGPVIAGASRSGILPKLGWRDLLKPLATVLACSYACALIFGLIGYFGVKQVPSWVIERVPSVVELPKSKEAAFTGDLFAHNASYIASTVGALSLCVWIILRRMRLHRVKLLEGATLESVLQAGK